LASFFSFKKESQMGYSFGKEKKKKNKSYQGDVV